MGTVLASAILAQVDTVLLDTAKTRWPDAEKLEYLNDGQRQLVLYKPDAFVVNDVYSLVAGTKQGIPDGTNAFQNAVPATLDEGIALIKVIRNMGTDGLTPGAVIRPVGIDFLDTYNPDWHSESQVAAAKNYIFDDSDPTRFYVSPPNTGTGYVEVAYSAVPGNVAAVGNAITLRNVYRDALRDYILFRCYDKDAALSPLNANRSIEKFNLFVGALGRMDLVRKVISPNMPKRNPSTDKVIQ
jgi:hypothetical protein